MLTTYMGQLYLMSLYFTVINTIPAPVNFSILSNNFKHILLWSPGTNSPPETVFNFEKICGRKKTTIQMNIRNTTVDVSKTLRDIYAKCDFYIWASFDNMNSSKVLKSITPYENTIIGPPVVFLSGCVNCLNISISLPNESRETRDLNNFYNSVQYNISWKKKGHSVINQVFVSNNHYLLQNLHPGEQYCVRVIPKIIFNQNTRPSAWQCEYSGGDRKEEPKGVSILSWSVVLLGLSGSAVFLLVFCLVYTGFICKQKAPESLKNIPQASYLTPESVSSTEATIIVSKMDHTNNYPLNQKKDSKNKQYEVYKADTDDEEDNNEDDYDDGGSNCIYMGCEMNSSGCESKNSKEKAIVSTSPPHNSSEDFCTAGAVIEQIHNHELDCKKQFNSEVSEDIDGHLQVKNTPLELEENEDSTGASGNINLFSVTLRALNTKDDLDEEEEDEEEAACKPLLAKPEISKDRELSGSPILLLEEKTEEYLPPSTEMRRQLCVPVQTEMKTDDLMQVESQEDLLPVCPSTLEPRNKHDTSGYMVSQTGNIQEQDSSLSEEADSDIDCDYITR